ncbi:uncharacterized protein LOC107645073 [Arachis ipaensis]|uniref:DUF2062 domain-containing protein n=1 Tax=Arachis hypogaea TaxID=3818 RepID=A0A6B9V253_ARAHY|nr:uncharacterized protein LOC107645073 [Arachis ipaensis]XP_025657267.1 uncharacterized protein LOC112752088 isoform X2 [Arachis hypogaea]QHN75393.1 uncharacterized protein DS421_19g635030 [Arachis hypogaea]
MATGKTGITSWFQKKITDPLISILRRGAEPSQLAFSAALGITLGVFPICGVTVFLCGIVIALLGSNCHAPTVMLANFIATPVELSLIVPFLRFGEFICGGPHFTLTSDALKKVLTGRASHEVLLSIAHALLGWLAASPVILGALYIALVPCFKVLVQKFSSVPSSPKKPLLRPHSEVRLKEIEQEKGE